MSDVQGESSYFELIGNQLFSILLGGKDVIKLVLHNASVGARYFSGISVKIPVDDTRRETILEMNPHSYSLTASINHLKCLTLPSPPASGP